MAQLEPITPGEILLEEFIEPFGITRYKLAKAIDVPPQRISAIINDGRAITADTALRLAKYFGNSAEFWTNLQSRYEFEVLSEELAQALNDIEPIDAQSRVA